MPDYVPSAMPMGCLTVALLGQTITITYSPQNARWPQRLRELLAPFNVEKARTVTSTISVTQLADLPAWQVAVNGASDRTIQDEDALLRQVEWQVFALAVGRADAVAVLHAGAVARNNAAIVLPATSGSGKTTLAVALSAQGWDVLTDDLCPIQEQADLLAAQPFPRCCHLDDASLAVLHHSQVSFAGPIANVPGYFRPQFAANPAPIRWIVSPRYAAGGAVALEPLSQAASAAVLLESIFAHSGITQREHWQVAMRLATQAPGYRLTYSALDDAFAAINQLVGR